jgi:hypothetical protein
VLRKVVGCESTDKRTVLSCAAALLVFLKQQNATAGAARLRMPAARELDLRHDILEQVFRFNGMAVPPEVAEFAEADAKSTTPDSGNVGGESVFADSEL